MTATAPPVLLDVADGVATITLNRPDAMNSLDVATKEALLDAVRAGRRRRRRALRRADRHRPGVLRRPGPQGAHRDPARARSSDALFRTVDEHYNPIVTALADDAEAGHRRGQRRRGRRRRQPGVRLRPADRRRHRRLQPGLRRRRAVLRHRLVSWTLQRLVGRAKAMELLYFPRTISADEALELGLATRVVPAARARRRGRATLAAPAGRRPDGGARRDPPVGGVRRRPRLRGVAGFEAAMMTLTGATADHRRRGRGVRGQGEAGLRGPLSVAAPRPWHSRRAPPRQAPNNLRRGRTRPQLERRRGRAVLDGERDAAEAVVEPPSSCRGRRRRR